MTLSFYPRRGGDFYMKAGVQVSVKSGHSADDNTQDKQDNFAGLAKGRVEKGGDSTSRFLTDCASNAFDTLNQSSDIFKGKLFYGFRYRMKDGEQNAFVFSDGSVIAGKEPKLPFACRSQLVFHPNQLSSKIIPLWAQGKIKSIDGKQLFDGIVSKLKEYIELKKDIEYKMVVLWLFHTYFNYPLGVTPYIHVNGQAGSGKSTLMRYCAKLAFKGWFVIKPSPSSLFRYIDSTMCTTFFDEFESYTETEKGDVFSVLNDGYVRDGQIPRVRNLQTGEYTVDIFNPFCSKMFSSVTDVRMGTFTSRCIELFVLRTDKIFKDIVVLPDAEAEYFLNTRDSLYLWHLLNWERLLSTYRSLKVEGYSGRTLQILKPLLVYAEEFGIYDEVVEYYGQLMTDRTAHDTEYDKDFLFMRALHELVIQSSETTLTAERILDRYSNILKDVCGFTKQEFMPTKKSVGWKIRKLDVCKKERTPEGNRYVFTPVILLDRIRRYGYGGLLEPVFQKDIEKGEAPEEEVV